MKNLITWVSIPSIDFDRAVNFYSNITGTKLEVSGEGDQKMATSLNEDTWNDVVGFGITADSTIKPGGSGPRIYIAVKDMDELLSKVETSGGKILNPKTTMGEMGFWGLIEDSEGNNIGLHSLE